MKCDVGSVSTGPFDGVSSFFADTLQGFSFQFCRYLFFPDTHLYKQYTDFLRFGNLVVPPVVAVRIAFIPIFQPFHYLIIDIFVLIVSILRVGVGKCKIIQSVYVSERFPVCTVAAAVVHVGETAFGGIVFV